MRPEELRKRLIIYLSRDIDKLLASHNIKATFEFKNISESNNKDWMIVFHTVIDKPAMLAEVSLRVQNIDDLFNKDYFSDLDNQAKIKEIGTDVYIKDFDVITLARIRLLYLVWDVLSVKDWTRWDKINIDYNKRFGLDFSRHGKYGLYSWGNFLY